MNSTHAAIIASAAILIAILGYSISTQGVIQVTEEKVEKGDTIQVHYTGTLENGDVFDSSEGKEPLKFSVGSGQIIKGFDEGVQGMKEGEEKTIQIPSNEAYGPRDETRVLEIPKENFGEQDVKEGQVVAFTHESGQIIQGKVLEVKEDKVKVDFNHPLAGKDLTFKVKIVGIEKGAS